MRLWLILLSLILVYSSFNQIYGNSHDRLNVGIGSFNVRRSHLCPQYQIEYQWAGLDKHFFPFVGLMVNCCGSSYAYTGIGYEWQLDEHFIFTPSLAVGGYSRCRGKDLHCPLEFRSALELAYQFKNHARLGLQFSHISNASIAKRNPGVESLILTYCIPIKY